MNTTQQTKPRSSSESCNAMEGGDWVGAAVSNPEKLGYVHMPEVFKLTGDQIESILSTLVPLIAAPEDHAYFRGVLRLKAEESTASGFAAFVSKLLNQVNGGALC